MHAVTTYQTHKSNFERAVVEQWLKYPNTRVSTSKLSDDCLGWHEMTQTYQYMVMMVPSMRISPFS